MDRDGWYKSAKIIVDQKDGPRKAFLFRRFFADLPEDYNQNDIRVKKEPGVERSDLENLKRVVGRLPE